MRMRDLTALIAASAAAAIAAGGCSGSAASGDPCLRRPWECATPDAGDGDTRRPVGGTGSCESYVPPANSTLPSNPKLPDPFESPDGTRITAKDQWPCRRAEIAIQAQAYELGTKP